MEFDQLSHRVIGCAIEVHRELGPGLLEPYGSPQWMERIAKSLGLESTLRPRGRPKKQ